MLNLNKLPSNSIAKRWFTVIMKKFLYLTLRQDIEGILNILVCKFCLIQFEGVYINIRITQSK